MTTASILPIAPPRDDEPLFEIIDGRQVDLPPSSYYAGLMASHLFHKLALFHLRHDIGELVSEVLFHLPLKAERCRRPDVAFVSYKRWPKGKPSKTTDNAWPVVPNLAVEVISPTDGAEEVMEKIGEYFQAGVELVWVVYSSLQLWTVYESLAQSRTLTVADELDGGTLLPSFRLPLGAFFAELPAES